MKKMAYIYTLEHPEGNIRYVGQSIDPVDRFKHHLNEARHNICKDKSNWLKSLLEKGEKPILNIW